MATDSTNLPQGDTNLDASSDMSGSELDVSSVQLAQVEGAQPVQLPKGNQVVLVPVQPGQVIQLPTDTTTGLLAKIGPEGNLSFVVDGRTIILQGYVKANDQSPVKIFTNDGDPVDAADVVAATDPSLNIQTAAGPATGNQGDTADGSGIFVPFLAGPGLGGIGAEGVLGATALQYKLIDDDRKLFTEDEDRGPGNIDISFDILGGIVNEDDLPADQNGLPQLKLVVKDVGNDGKGNDEFDDDTTVAGPHNDKAGGDATDGVPDSDREPLVTVATVKVDFPDEDTPGTLTIDTTLLPTGLKSEGQDIIYEVIPAGGGVGNQIIAFVDGGGDPTKFDSPGDRQVFSIKVDQESSDSVFTVTFTLSDNIDNTAPDANGDGAPDLLGANEQVLDLPVHMVAEDSDGSTKDATLPLGVQDDIPFFGEVVSIGDGIDIVSQDAGVTHDETAGVDNPDDQDLGDVGTLPQDLIDLATSKGFSQPTEGESAGTLHDYGVAQKQVIASFGADGAAVFQDGPVGDAVRDSVFGAVSGSGENEHPFELFMIDPNAGNGTTPVEDNGNTPLVNEGNLTATDQKTNATVTWNGEQVLPVYLHQIDAHTIVGYVIPAGGEEPPLEEARVEALALVEGQEAVFIINIDDQGVLTFVQLHQVNNPIFPDSYDEPLTILAEDGVTPLVHVRITDFDGDHATQPVNIVIEDDGPTFIDVTFTQGNGTVDEDFLGKLGPGNHDLDLVSLSPLVGAPGDNSGGTSTAGTINFDIGVDRPGVLAFGELVITDSAGKTIDISALKTADGNGITIVQSGPDGDGVVTLTGIEAGSGDKAFTMTLDTAGDDIGDFKFTLNQALKHPYTDSDFNNDDNPESRYEDDLNFAFNVKATDIDKDVATGTINIVVDDDSPRAIDDFDVVTEGKTGGNLNIATGNVVTGVDATLLGKDSNSFPLDGILDLPGADRPYTISKLVHGDDTYNLVDNGDGTFGVTKNGGDPLDAGESFDTTTGVLKIPTDEGGTFEIIMESTTQSQVGEYRYTVPADADHDEDKLAGPETLLESQSFGDGAAWASKFAADGITLTAIGGTLASKTVNVNPKNAGLGVEDYGGVGVSSGNGDEAEVDNAGPDEKLQLEFATPTDNAKLLIGAFFDGSQFDSGNQEILLWQVFDAADNLVASGQILGSDNGLVNLDIDTHGVAFDRIVLTPVNNGAGDTATNNSDFVLVNVETCSTEDKFKEQFEYTLRDSDGDESTATLNIDVKDTQPTIPGNSSGGEFIRVDEDGLPNGIGDSVSPNDDTTTNSASFHGFINFTPGADPVTIELTVGNGGDTKLDTVDGKNVFAAWDEESHTLVGYIEGTNPANVANQVFTVHVINEQTGEYEFTLLKPLEHSDLDQEGGDNTENVIDLQLKIDVQIEDKDCDVAYTSINITIDDDMPVLTLGSGSFALAVDESLDGDTIANNAGDNPQNPGYRIEDDEDGANLPSVLTGLGTVIGASKASGSPLFSYSPGADGLQSAVYTLTLAGGGPVATGLKDSQSDSLISLVQGPNNVIEGRTVVGNILVFAFNVDAGTGEVSMAQYRAINHGAEEAAPGNHDEEKVLGTGGLSVTLTVTDKDGDTVTKSSDITAKITFDDDGPKANIEKANDGDNQVVHDETPGKDLDADDQSGSLPAIFSGVGLIGWARSSDPVVATTGTEYGTDGAGTTVLSLKISGPGVDSGLDDTQSGNNILLFQNGDIVEGRVEISGELVFAIAINTDGTIDVAQYRAIEHPTFPNSFDEEIGLNDGVLQAWVTVTDKDGDSATDQVDIGSRVRFQDDGPTADINVKDGAEIRLDESVGVPTGFPDANANDEAGNVAGDIAYAKVAGNLLFVDNSTFGTDGAGTKTYSLALSLDGTNSGLEDVATGSGILLFQVDADTVEGRVGSSGGAVAFRIDLNATNGEVTISQFLAVKHDNPGSTASDHDESDSPEIMDQDKLFIRQTVTDGDLDSGSDTIDLGKLIKFEDDGPVANADTDSVTEDGVENAVGNVYAAANVTAFGSDTNVTDGVSDDVGSDGLNSLQWVEGKGFDGDGQISGQFGTLFVNAAGDYKYVVDNSNPAFKDLDDGETFLEEFSYVITDKDGDTATSTLTITIKGHSDALPPSAEDALARVDEDGIPVIGNNDSKSGDDNADAAPDTAVPDEHIFRAGLPVNWNGTPGDITLAAGDWSQLKAIDGSAIVAVASIDGHILQGYDADDVTAGVPNPGATAIFEVKILNTTTGDYEVTLFKPLQHPDSNNNHADDASDSGAGLFEDNVSIPVNVTYTNIAGTDNAVLTIDVDDDSPTAVVTATGIAAIVLDETRPIGTETDGDSTPAGLATVTVNLAGSFAAADFGADGAGSVSYALALTGTNVPSGLFALDQADTITGDGDGIGQGTQIVLNQAGNIITGSVGATTYFTIEVNPATGAVTFTQSNNVWHSSTASDDDTSTLNLANANLLQLVQKVTDADGDSATAGVNLGQGVFQIEDDGPNAEISNAVAAAAVLDETRPIGTETDGDSAPAGLATVTTNYAGNFAAANFGTDGAGSVSYALALTGTNVPSGLFALDQADTISGDGDGIGQGTQIVLNQAGNIITGSVGATNYFTIEVNPGTGAVTFTQLNNVWHSNTGSDDDTSTLNLANANLLQLIQSVTDRDGDTDTAALNLGQGVFQIEDDGPNAEISNVVAAAAVLDETRPIGTETDGDSAPAGLATVTTNYAGNFAAANFGTDGAGSVSYALQLTGTNVPSGLFALDQADTITGDGDGIGQGTQIVLNQAGNIITGSVGATNYFTIEVNPGTGAVTFTQLNNVWHSNTGSDDDTSTLNLSNANLLQLIQSVTDRDGDKDTAALNLGQGVFQIEDDGPNADVFNAIAAAITLDETRPLGSDTDGAAPAGLATATANYSLNFAAANFGTDGAGNVSYALALTGTNVPSGLFALEQADTITGDGDGIGQGTQIVLNQAGNVITGSVGATTYFTIEINPSTGVVTFTQSNNIWHSSTASDDDTSTLTLSNANLLRVIQSVTDRDGDTDTASIDLGSGVFKIQDDGPNAEVSNAIAVAITLDETRPIGSDTDGGAPAGLATATANYALNFAPVSYGTDGAGSVGYSLALTGSNVPSGLFALDGADKSAIDGDGYGQGTQIVLNLSGNTITGSVGATNYFTIEVNPSTGVVTFTQLNNIWHSNTVSDDETATLTLANANLLQLVQTVTDRDGDKDTASINLGTGVFQIQDDGPVANPLTKSITADTGVNTNLLITLDISGSMDEASGLTNLDKLQAAVAAVKELIDQYDAMGDVKVRLCTFSTGAQEVGAVWMTPAEARTFLTTLLDDEGTTNYDAALNAARNAFPDSGQIVGAQNVAYFLSDGNANTPSGSAGIDATEEAVWVNFLKDNDINSFALGFGKAGDVNQSQIDPIAYNGQTDTNTNGVVITDLNLLTAALVATVSAPIGGNVKTDGTNKNGTDVPGIVSKITFGANTFEFDGTNITRTAGSLAFTGVGGVLNFTTANGTFQINMNTGAYTYALLADAAANDLFGYTLTDADGDSATSTLQITASVTDIAPIVRDDHVYTNVSGSGAAIVVPQSAFLWNDSDANGDAITFGAISSVNDLTSVTPAAGNVTITDNDTDGGTFTYTGTANGKSDTGDVDVKRGQAGETDLDGNGLDNILVGRDGANDTLNGFEGNDVLLGGSGNDALNGGTGRDWLVGGDGNDILNGGAGNDLIEGGSGTRDLLDFSNVNTDWSFTLGAGGSGTASIDGTDTYSGIEGVVGGNGNNIITGNAGNNFLFGGEGGDTLNGGDGDDFLDGGESGDTYDGGKGIDTFEVGDGNDTIVYNLVANLNAVDVVNGFDNDGTNHDVVNLDALFDALNVATGDRAGRVSVVDVGSDTELRVDLDGNGSDETTILTFVGISSTGNFSFGNTADDDIKLGTN